MDPTLRERLAAVSRARTQVAAPPTGINLPTGAAVPLEWPCRAAPGPTGAIARRRGRAARSGKILPRAGNPAELRGLLAARAASGGVVGRGCRAGRAGRPKCRADPPLDLAEDAALAGLRRTGPAGGLTLDLETTGLAGMPVFLAGILAPGPLAWNGTADPSDVAPGLRFRLYLARDYREEAPLLEALAAEFAAWPTVITYNGKSYYLPYLRERAARLRVCLPEVVGHLDLLHPARRRWARRLPDCRLTTLEWHLCGRRRRVGDIPGAEIPAAYHRWVRSGIPARCCPCSATTWSTSTPWRRSPPGSSRNPGRRRPGSPPPARHRSRASSRAGEATSPRPRSRIYSGWSSWKPA